LKIGTLLLVAVVVAAAASNLLEVGEGAFHGFCGDVLFSMIIRSDGYQQTQDYNDDLSNEKTATYYDFVFARLFAVL
jgi:hypothetical protein